MALIADFLPEYIMVNNNTRCNSIKLIYCHASNISVKRELILLLRTYAAASLYEPDYFYSNKNTAAK